jgi:hypothetical protein
MTAQLETNTVVKTRTGEWVQVVSQWDNMVTVDYVASFRGRDRRDLIHVSNLLLNTAHKLSKKLS